MTEQVNIHGRKPGRGIRPWLLIPKLLGVAVYFGGLVGAAMLWFTSGYSGMDKSDPQRAWIVDAIGSLFLYATVPGLLVAIAMGIVLYAQHPKEFRRMRWWRVKMVWLLIYVPGMHLWMSSRLGLLRESATAQVHNDAAASQLSWGFVVAILGAAVVIWLGRHKPRLGQGVRALKPA